MARRGGAGGAGGARAAGHRRGAGAGARRRHAGAVGPLGHRRWRSRRWPTCCGRGSCATTRRDPEWPDRDRFVLSAGHGSMLLYSMLLPHGLRPRRSTTSRRSGSSVAHAGTPRVRPHPRRRGHHGPARPGLRQRRRHRRSPKRTCGAASAPRSSTTACSPSAPTATSMEGVSHEAASLAGHLGLGQAGLRLRRQPHHASTAPPSSRFTDDVGRALRGLRLARPGRGRGPNDLDVLEAAPA